MFDEYSQDPCLLVALLRGDEDVEQLEFELSARAPADGCSIRPRAELCRLGRAEPEPDYDHARLAREGRTTWG